MRCRERNGNHASRQAPYSVLIVDDDELIRRGIAAILSDEPDLTVCGSAGDESTAVKLLERHKPDLLLLDLSLGRRDGVQFLKDIAGRFAHTLIIALSEYGDGLYATRAFHAGASGYLSKHASAAQFITTVRAVVAGATHTQPSRSSVNGTVPRSKARDHSINRLTDRELHVFRLIGAGLGTTRIAQELGLSRKTIETYREHIKLKLGYSNAEALRKGSLEWAHHFPAESLDSRKIGEIPR